MTRSVTYLDHAATTPLRREVLEAMLPFLTDHFGNPSGSHAIARRARTAIDEARDVVAGFLGCGPGEVVFTGGGTEADNLAVLGVLARRPGGVAVCSAIEHHAVLHAVHAAGGRVVPAAEAGVVDLDALHDHLDGDVAVVAVMLVNNETGAVQPLDDVVAIVRDVAPTAVVHTDAVQAAPWFDLSTAAAGADLVAVSAHKIGGPKGVGALAVRSGVELAPILHGGGQERDRRSGTHNVASIVGMAAAMSVAAAEREAANARIRSLRDRLAAGVLAAVPGSRTTVDLASAVPGICHLLLPGVESEALLVLLDDEGVCASAGSACASGAMEPSHVLTAMAIDKADALSSIRLSLGPTTTEADVDHAVAVVARAAARLRDDVA